MQEDQIYHETFPYLKDVLVPGSPGDDLLQQLPLVLEEGAEVAALGDNLRTTCDSRWRP
jgi:hypothetical protein